MMEPTVFLAELKEGKSHKVKKTLDALFSVCMDQLKSEVGDFSVATIARIGRVKGVPRAQSILNASGIHYRVLIKYFHDISLEAAPKLVNKRYGADDWIEGIVDPRLKLLVKIQSAELRKVKSLMSQVIPLGTVVEVIDRVKTDEVLRLTSQEATALKYLCSADFLRRNRFAAGSRGDVINSEGNEVFKVATLDALLKVIKFCD